MIKKDLANGELTLDHSRYDVSYHGRCIRLTAIEFKLLEALSKFPGEVQGRDQLLAGVWGYHGIVNTRTVDTHIRRLREKLGEASRYIQTVYGVGYQMIEVSNTR